MTSGEKSGEKLLETVLWNDSEDGDKPGLELLDSGEGLPLPRSISTAPKDELLQLKHLQTIMFPVQLMVLKRSSLCSFPQLQQFFNIFFAAF